VRAILHSALDLLYPRTCVSCGEDTGSGEGHLCWECFSQIPVISRPFCEQCGDPVDGKVEDSYRCSLCRRKEPWFEMARSAFRHRGPVQKMVHAFKYGCALNLREELSGFLHACVTTHYANLRFDAVTAVPLYPRRERERSYNQAWVLASSLGARMKIEAFSRCIARRRDTATQTNLDSSARRKNVRSAFEACNEKWIRSRRFLLVDDVMTTGATANEVSRVLKEAGAASVHVLTLARG
jgi:competence protein ComFC